MLPNLLRLLLELCAGGLLDTDVDPEPDPDAAGILSGMLLEGWGNGDSVRELDIADPMCHLQFQIPDTSVMFSDFELGPQM